MTEQNQIEIDATTKRNRKRRNIILGIVLGIASLTMYASIFIRISNPL
ncbi:MAG: hypothetical protein NWR87_04635 [Rhodospirillales bacterium]|nr:hypothetical protein [Rhodospirillales bacterium]